jgi:hypothetical protein
MRLSDAEVLHELLQQNKYRDISESKYNSDNEINVNISSCRDACVKSGAEQLRFQFTGKPDINVDLEDPSKPLEYFEFFLHQILRK